MKQGKLVRTRNVVEADEAINLLVTRPKEEMVGLGLLYGKPGLGKTTYATRIALQRNYVYLRLEATSTPKSFTIQLITGIYNYLNLEYPPLYGTTNAIFRRCMDEIERHEDIVIIVDEIDYAFKQQQLLGTIRDIVDNPINAVRTNPKRKALHIFTCHYDLRSSTKPNQGRRKICNEASRARTTKRVKSKLSSVLS